MIARRQISKQLVKTVKKTVKKKRKQVQTDYFTDINNTHFKVIPIEIIYVILLLIPKDYDENMCKALPWLYPYLYEDEYLKSKRKYLKKVKPKYKYNINDYDYNNDYADFGYYFHNGLLGHYNSSFMNIIKRENTEKRERKKHKKHYNLQKNQEIKHKKNQQRNHQKMCLRNNNNH